VADPKSDVFGAGAVLYYMLCGRAPYDQTLPGDRPSSAFDRTFERPRSLNPAVPDAVASVVTQAMSEYSRFNTAGEMREALDEAARISRV
jgi:serine/threonine-protein kinase